MDPPPLGLHRYIKKYVYYPAVEIASHINHGYSVSGLNFLLRLESLVGWYTVLCKMLLFCAKTIMKESIFKSI